MLEDPIVGLGSVENLPGKRVDMSNRRLRFRQQPKDYLGERVPNLLVGSLRISNSKGGGREGLTRSFPERGKILQGILCIVTEGQVT